MAVSLGLLLVGFLLLAVAAVVATVLIVVFRRPAVRAYDPDDDHPAGPTPLERARAAASALSPAEWEEFRRWVEVGSRPLPRDEGITQ